MEAITFFQYVEGLTPHTFVNITGDTVTDFEKFKEDALQNHYEAINKLERTNQTTVKILFESFIKDRNKIQLLPLAEKPLNSQLFWHFGNFVNSDDLLTGSKEAYHVDKGISFFYASEEEETVYKEAKAEAERKEAERKAHEYDNHPNIIIDLHNHQRWEEGLKAAKSKPFPVVEMTKEAFWHFLECVPPKRYERVAFLCGEPYTHNSKGEGVYLGGIEKRGKYYAQYGTIKQFDNKEMFKSI